MESLSEPEERNPFWTVGVLCILRNEGNRSEEEIAQKLRFDNVEEMHNQLENWNIPAWLAGDNKATLGSVGASDKTSDRKARNSGPAKNLPPASNATPLFRERLEALATGNEQLQFVRSRLQGKRFTETKVYPDPVHVHPGHVPEELLQRDAPELKEKGANHSTGFLFNMGESKPAPQAPLPALVAAYVLAGGDMGALLDALYPGTPSAEVVEKVRKKIEDKKGPKTEDGLTAIAEQLAALVRGKELRKGRDPRDIPARDHSLACRITERREADFPDEAIRQELRLTKKEFRRLADLKMRWPWV